MKKWSASDHDIKNISVISKLKIDEYQKENFQGNEYYLKFQNTE